MTRRSCSSTGEPAGGAQGGLDAAQSYPVCLPVQRTVGADGQNEASEATWMEVL